MSINYEDPLRIIFLISLLLPFS